MLFLARSQIPTESGEGRVSFGMIINFGILKYVEKNYLEDMNFDKISYSC